MITRRVVAIAVLAMALASASCSVGPDPDEETSVPAAQTIEGSLGKDQIKGLVSGKTGFGQEQRFQWRTYYAADGTMQGRIWGDFGEEFDQGTWEVTEENQLCRQWSRKWESRERACFEIFKDGEQIKLINVDGKADSYEMMLVSGNKVQS